MRYFITFGDNRFRKSCKFGAKAAAMFGGFDKAIIYSPNDIDETFRKANEEIFRINRGYGLWLWKPYFIYKTLTDLCSDGDYLFYADGGSFFIRSVKNIEKAMGSNDIWVSHNSLLEWQFTKKDAFDLMECHGVKYERTSQAQGGFLYIHKTNETVKFIKEWLDLCCDIRLLHPENILSKADNPSGFISHREDQSVLSLLCKKKGLRLYQDPTQYGKYPEKYWKSGFEHIDNIKKEYPVCIVLHRTGDLKLSIIFRQLVLTILPRKMGKLLIRN